MPTVAGNRYNQDPGGSRPTSGPRNAQEAIAAQSNAKRAAANTVGATRSPAGVSYGGGPLTQDVGSFRRSSGGTLGTSYSAPPNPMGYTPGSFDDPTIDWQAIYDIFIAGNGGTGGSTSPGGASTQHYGASEPAVVNPPAPTIFEAPAVMQAPSVAPPPAVVNSTATEAPGTPEGNKFQTFGSPSTFGGFERMRNKRGPLNNASVTPEMLRRAAASRLG